MSLSNKSNSRVGALQVILTSVVSVLSCKQPSNPHFFIALFGVPLGSTPVVAKLPWGPHKLCKHWQHTEIPSVHATQLFLIGEEHVWSRLFAVGVTSSKDILPVPLGSVCEFGHHSFGGCCCQVSWLFGSKEKLMEVQGLIVRSEDRMRSYCNYSSYRYVLWFKVTFHAKWMRIRITCLHI